jgi:hypothetical protein
VAEELRAELEAAQKQAAGLEQARHQALDGMTKEKGELLSVRVLRLIQIHTFTDSIDPDPYIH